MPAQKKYQKRRGRKPAAKKRVAKKRPYRRNNRMAVARSLNPIVEGRKLVVAANQTTLLAADWTVIIPNSWEKMPRENALEGQPEQLTSSGFTGNTLFSRYINQHLQINFDRINHISAPVNMRIMYGWAKIPYVTQYQAVGGNVAGVTRNAQGVLVHYDPTAFVKQALEIQYDGLLPVNDPKKFKMFHNKEYFIRGVQGSGIEFDGMGQPLEMNRINRRVLDFYPKWKPMKKYHMMSATAVGGSGSETVKPDDYFPVSPAVQGFWTPDNLKQELWYPFFAINFKNHDDYGRDSDGAIDTSAVPNYVQKNSHYFYDM